MKKLLFTVIAAVAFSGVMMGENRTQIQKTKLMLNATPCQNMMLDIYEYTMNTYNCGGDDINLLNALLSNCK